MFKRKMSNIPGTNFIANNSGNSTTNIPLYDNFYRASNDKELTKEEREDFMEKIEGIDEKGAELVFVLLKKYAIDNGDKALIPLQGKYIGKNLQFDTKKLPPKLVRMIYNFITQHIKAMQEKIERPVLPF